MNIPSMHASKSPSSLWQEEWRKPQEEKVSSISLVAHEKFKFGHGHPPSHPAEGYAEKKRYDNELYECITFSLELLTRRDLSPENLKEVLEILRRDYILYAANSSHSSVVIAELENRYLAAVKSTKEYISEYEQFKNFIQNKKQPEAPLGSFKPFTMPADSERIVLDLNDLPDTQSPFVPKTIEVEKEHSRRPMQRPSQPTVRNRSETRDKIPPSFNPYIQSSFVSKTSGLEKEQSAMQRTPQPAARNKETTEQIPLLDSYLPKPSQPNLDSRNVTEMPAPRLSLSRSEKRDAVKIPLPKSILGVQTQIPQEQNLLQAPPKPVSASNIYTTPEIPLLRPSATQDAIAVDSLDSEFLKRLSEKRKDVSISDLLSATPRDASPEIVHVYNKKQFYRPQHKHNIWTVYHTHPAHARRPTLRDDIEARIDEVEACRERNLCISDAKVKQKAFDNDTEILMKLEQYRSPENFKKRKNPEPESEPEKKDKPQPESNKVMKISSLLN